MRGRLPLVAALMTGVVLALGAAPGSAATTVAPPQSAVDEDAERALAEKFAPVVHLVNQPEECGPGEPYRPSDVETVLGDPSVSLRGPWEDDELVTSAPTADDLGAGLFGYHLDFPGNPLEAGCDYEEWSRTTSPGTQPTTYAHVVTEEGRADRLALQYWFFYPFNDYTNKHEGDWEMVQLLFTAADAEEALAASPYAIGFSQHEGMEVADWGDPKLEIVDDTHPVVHPAAGSHANFFNDALYLGTSAEQGFGCDDTREPDAGLSPAVAVIPSAPAAARAAYPWIGYEGRWGQREQSFYNGPTGPNTKDSWTHPVSYQEENGRDVSLAVPAGGLLGTSATDFFCSAVSGGSEVVRRLADDPVRLLVIVAAIAVLAGYLIRRTTWSPPAPLRLARRRAGGQMIRAAARLYAAHRRLFVGIGLLTIPVSLLVAALQAALVAAPDVGAVTQSGEGGGIRVTIAAFLGYGLLGTSILLVLAATTYAAAEIDRNAEVSVRRAYALCFARWRPLLGAFAASSALVVLLSLSVVLFPVAVVLIALFALFVPVIVFEQSPAVASLRRSGALVRHQIGKTAVLLLSSILLAGAVGPILGTFLILLTGAPFWVANLVAGLTFAVLMPYIGLTMTYLYFDARVRAELAEEETDQMLPAEIS